MFSYILAPLHININLQDVSELLTCFEGSMVSEDSQITCGRVNWLSSGVWFTAWACRAWPEPPGHAEAHALREARAVHRLLFSGEASRPY